MRVRRFMGACSHSVRNWMRRLTWIPCRINPVANDAIDFCKRSAAPDTTDGIPKYLEQLIEQPIVFGSKAAGAKIFCQVGPVAVGADPDLDKRWFVFDHGTMARGGESGDSTAGPDQRKGTGHFDLALVANADRMNVALDHRGYFAFFHSRMDMIARVHHAESREFVGQTHALNFLRRLDHADFREKWRSVHNFAAAPSKRIVETLPVDCRLSDHAIANLRRLR